MTAQFGGIGPFLGRTRGPASRRRFRWRPLRPSGAASRHSGWFRFRNDELLHLLFQIADRLIGNIRIHADETVPVGRLVLLGRHRSKSRRRLVQLQTIGQTVSVHIVRLGQIVIQRIRLGHVVVNDARLKFLLGHSGTLLDASNVVGRRDGDDGRSPQGGVNGRDSARSGSSSVVVNVVNHFVFVLLQYGAVRDPLADRFGQSDALGDGIGLAGFPDAPPSLRHLLDRQNVALLEFSAMGRRFQFLVGRIRQYGNAQFFRPDAEALLNLFIGRHDELLTAGKRVGRHGPLLATRFHFGAGGGFAGCVGIAGSGQNHLVAFGADAALAADFLTDGVLLLIGVVATLLLAVDSIRLVRFHGG